MESFPIHTMNFSDMINNTHCIMKMHTNEKFVPVPEFCYQLEQTTCNSEVLQAVKKVIETSAVPTQELHGLFDQDMFTAHEEQSGYNWLDVKYLCLFFEERTSAW